MQKNSAITQLALDYLTHVLLFIVAFLIAIVIPDLATAYQAPWLVTNIPTTFMQMCQAALVAIPAHAFGWTPPLPAAPTDPDSGTSKSSI